MNDVFNSTFSVLFRVLSLPRGFYHINPILEDLHWLLVERGIEYKCYCSVIKLAMSKPRHIAPFVVSVCTEQAPGIRNKKYPQSTKIPFGRVWLDIALHMPLNRFDTLPPHRLNVPLPLMPSRAAWRLIYLMWHIPQFNDSYFVWIYCLYIY